MAWYRISKESEGTRNNSCTADAWPEESRNAGDLQCLSVSCAGAPKRQTHQATPISDTFGFLDWNSAIDQEIFEGIVQWL
jgi:hypothetical protein